MATIWQILIAIAIFLFSAAIVLREMLVDIKK